MIVRAITGVAGNTIGLPGMVEVSITPRVGVVAVGALPGVVVAGASMTRLAVGLTGVIE
jgi:hypothetical protein